MSGNQPSTSYNTNNNYNQYNMQPKMKQHSYPQTPRFAVREINQPQLNQHHHKPQQERFSPSQNTQCTSVRPKSNRNTNM